MALPKGNHLSQNHSGSETLERGEEEGIGRSSAATLTKEDKSIEAESGAMTDYEEEITMPETTSSAASFTTEKLSTLTLEKINPFSL